MATPRDVLAGVVEAEVVVAPELPLSWNVAPSAQLYVAARVRSQRRLGTMSWGLLPWWAPDPRKARRPINARAETMARNRYFADCVSHRRCLVVADGFYEWERCIDGTKQPWYFTRVDGQPLVLAALWDRWGPRSVSHPESSCAIVTTAANEDMEGVHDRMPALVDPPDWEAWLDTGECGPEEAVAIAEAPTPGRLVSRRANRLANSTANDGPELLIA